MVFIIKFLAVLCVVEAYRELSHSRLISNRFLKFSDNSLSSTDGDVNIPQIINIPDPVSNEPGVEQKSIPQRRVTWQASAKASVVVKEQFRTVEAYMGLPASKYSVLSADQIQRLSDTEFKCSLATLNFFGTKITPVLYVDVNVIPEEAKSIISVTRAETMGSEMADIVNGTFSISSVNIVTAGIDNKQRKTLNSETSLMIDVVVPSDKLPLRVIQSGGNFIMQSTLTVIVQAFVRILAADFRRWSEGSDVRDAVEGEVLL